MQGKLPDESAHSVNLYVTGEPIPVTIGNVTLYLRQPTYIERDEADLKKSLFARMLEVDYEEIRMLTDASAPKAEIESLKRLIAEREKNFAGEKDEVRKRILNDRLNFMYEVIENRNAATMVIEMYSDRYRRRWYSRTLIQDKEGNPLDYDSMHPAVQDLIMSAVELMLEDIENLPLGLVQQPA